MAEKKNCPSRGRTFNQEGPFQPQSKGEALSEEASEEHAVVCKTAFTEGEFVDTDEEIRFKA